MAMYEFACESCGKAAIIQRPMLEGPPARVECETCPEGVAMHRVYAFQKPIVMLDGPGYMEKAYEGKEQVPGLTTKQVRAMIDTDNRTRLRGRANNGRRHYVRS